MSSTSIIVLAAVLLASDKPKECRYEQAFCTAEAPAHGGGTKQVMFPCVKKVCDGKNK